MNATARRATYRGVLRGLGVVLALAPLACGGALEERERAADQLRARWSADNRAGIAFHDELTWPFRLTRVMAAMDGAVLAQHRFETERAEPHLALWHGVLPSGPHTVQVLAEVAFASTRIDDDGCRVRVRRAASTACAGELALDVVLDARDVVKRFVDRPELAFRWRKDPAAPPAPGCEALASDWFLADRHELVPADRPECDDSAPLIEPVALDVPAAAR